MLLCKYYKGIQLFNFISRFSNIFILYYSHTEQIMDLLHLLAVRHRWVQRRTWERSLVASTFSVLLLAVATIEIQFVSHDLFLAWTLPSGSQFHLALRSPAIRWTIAFASSPPSSYQRNSGNFLLELLFSNHPSFFFRDREAEARGECFWKLLRFLFERGSKNIAKWKSCPPGSIAW